MEKLFKQRMANIVHIDDEYSEIVQEQMKTGNWLVKGLLPGVGKTTAVITLAKKYDINMLFVTPYNKLAIELRKDGVQCCTLAKVFGYKKAKSRINVNDYDAVCFDELALYNIKCLLGIYRFMNDHDNIRFFATMDLDQIQPFQMGLNHVTDMRAYIDRTITMMFPNQILLKQNKRLKTKAEQDRLHDMKKDIMGDTPMGEVCEKYGLNVIRGEYCGVQTTTNISYFNKTRVKVNQHVRENIVKKPYAMAKGDRVVLKRRIDGSTFVNELYKIVQIDKKAFTVSDGEYTIQYKIKYLDHFDFDYCNTCHSLQGCSTSDSITIFDSNSPHVDKYWLWTAVTRVRSFGQLNIFIHSESDVRKYNFSKMMQYFTFKVDKYKEQDKTAGRSMDNKDYIDAQWIYETFRHNRCCMKPECTAPFEFDDKYSKSNLTVQRWDSDFPHTKGNCLLLCVDCNRALKEHNQDMYV